MALLTVSQDLGVFGWGDDSQIFRDILSLPIMMPIVQGLVGPGFRMDHSPFCIRMQRGSEGQADITWEFAPGRPKIPQTWVFAHKRHLSSREK